MKLQLHDERQAAELLDALINLNVAAQAIAGQGDALALLAAGLAPDGVLQSETIALDANGTRTVESHVPATSIAVANLGTAVLSVANSGLGARPPGPGRGVLKVRPGAAICAPLLGTSHAFWGRPGELVTVVRYKTLQPFAATTGCGAYFGVSLGALAVGVPTVLYTTPWGDNAFYGGISVADTAGAAGSPDTSELVIADGNGLVLDEVNLAGRESTEDTFAIPIAAGTATIVATLTKGAVAGVVRVW